MFKILASLLACAAIVAASPVQASEPIVLQPLHQELVSAGAFALTQPAIRCFNGCSFHYFAPGETFTADYQLQSPIDGYWYLVVTVDGHTGYVLRPLIVGRGY